MQQTASSEDALFDHLVGEREQVIGDFDAKLLRSLQIDDKLEFGRLYDRQVGGLGALENFSGVELATYGDGRCQLWRLDAEQLGCLLQGLFKGAVVLSAFNPGW